MKALFDRTIELVRSVERVRRKRLQARRDRETVEVAIQRIVPDLVVRHGPFKGMRYPEVRSVGSTVFPKLIGSYERELHPTIEAICRTAYSEVVDVGCAEGYYAVGLALRLPEAKVFAYDTDRVAIAQCERMARLNQVAERVVVGSSCDPDTLRSIPVSGRALIISDCEGYERHLFTPEVVEWLAGHDVLVELHDFLDIEVSMLVRQRFQDSHTISVIDSLDDVKKAQTYAYEELSPYDLETRKVLLRERRPAAMEWFFMTPRR